MFVTDRTTETEPKYYADGEDAYAMRRDLVDWSRHLDIKPPHPEKFFQVDRRHRRQGRENNTSNVPAVEPSLVNAVASGVDKMTIAGQDDSATNVEDVEERKLSDSAKEPSAPSESQTAAKKKHKRRNKQN